MSAVTEVETKRITGQVKWFNNKAGYGFITMKDGDDKDVDIFTHYSTVQIGDRYKYLVQGEYVEFELISSNDERHQNQAAKVTGINGGKLMCETRQLRRHTNESEDPSIKKSERRHNDNRHKGGRDAEKTTSPDDANSDGFIQVQHRGGSKP